MAEIVYVLCAVASAACAVLLLRAYVSNRSRLLFWSGVCFAGLTLNSVLLVLDMLVIPSVDLSVARTATGAIAMFILVAGLVWESR